MDHSRDLRSQMLIIGGGSADLIVRGERVMFDSDHADFYGVTTHRLDEQAARDVDRSPRTSPIDLPKRSLED